MKIKHLVAGFIFLIIIGSGQAFAAFSNIVAFGDSLSDNGNADGWGLGRFTYPYATVWVENLAQINAGASLYDYAFGGATSGLGNVNPAVPADTTGLTWQVNNPFIQSEISALDPADTLFTVWAGGNDASAGTMPDVAAGNVIEALETLAGNGAQTILVPNLPNIGETPKFWGQPDSGLATWFSMTFNDYLYNGLLDFVNTNPVVDIYFLDVFALFDEFEPGSITWDLLFYTDGFHPSATGHWMVAEAAATVLSGDPVPPVPVPGAVILMASGLVGLVGLRRRQAA